MTAGAVLIPPYNHADIISGQGTMALELLDQVSGSDCVSDLPHALSHRVEPGVWNHQVTSKMLAAVCSRIDNVVI